LPNLWSSPLIILDNIRIQKHKIKKYRFTTIFIVISLHFFNKDDKLNLVILT